MFPARAGMSRGFGRGFAKVDDVPRASGDEPHTAPVLVFVLVCSPRERG